MRNSLDGSQRRQRTNTNAINDQGTASRPVGIVRSRNSFNPNWSISSNPSQGPPRSLRFSTAQALDVDFRPLRLDVVEEPLLTRPMFAFSGILDTQAMRFVELSEIRDHALPWAAFAAIRLH